MQARAYPAKRHKTRYPGVYYRESADGRRTYLIVYRDSTGKQRSRNVAGGLREAQAELEELRGRKRRGERIAPSKATLREVADAWLETQATRLRPGTRKLYRLNLDKHVYSRLGDRRIADVDEDDVAKLIASMTKAGYSPYTIRGVLTPLGRVLGNAARRGLIAGNPISKLERGERPSGGKREMRILDANEIGKLLEATSEMYRPLIATAIFTGIRQGELLGLSWADVDFDAETIRVRKQLDREGNLVEPKTRQAIRNVVLMPALASILRAHKARSGYSRPRDFVFASRAGTALHYRNAARRGLEKAMERARLNDDGRPKLRFHDLRHTFASLLIAQGANVVFVSHQIGHADPSITLSVYAHLFEQHEHAAKARDALDAQFGSILAATGGSRRGNTGSEREDNVVELQAISRRR